MRDSVVRITATIPAKLLEQAQEITELGIVETVVAGLEALERTRRRSPMSALRGLFRLDRESAPTRRKSA